LNVPRVLPIKPRKSNEIEKDECDKIYGLPTVKMFKFGFPVDGIAYSAQQIEAMMRQTIEVEADKMNNVEEEEPHHADLGPGAADDQAPLVSKQHLDLGHQLFSGTTRQAEMRSSTMKHLDRGEMNSLPYRTSSPA
jgi:hypothetical protein